MLFPPVTPSTDHVTFVDVTPFTVALNCSVCIGVIDPRPGLTLTAELATTPVPLKLTVCRNAGSVSLTVMSPVRDPVFDGANVTLIVQFVPALSDAGQLFVCE